MRRSRPGFTLIELLVVIAIIGTLMALLIPAVLSTKESGRRVTCLNNQKELALAALNFARAKEKLPGSWANIPATGVNNVAANQVNTSANPLVVEWPVLLFPYVGRNDLYQLVQNTQVKSWSTYAQTVNPNGWPQVSVLICPSAPPKTVPSPLSYAANCGQTDCYPPNMNAAGTAYYPFDWQDNGVFLNQYTYIPKVSGTNVSSAAYVPTVSQTMDYIAKWDGSSNTIMLTENIDATQWMYYAPSGGSDANSAYAPNDPRNTGNLATEWQIGVTWVAQDPPPVALNKQAGMAASSSTPQNFARPSSAHPGGFCVAMCDGSVTFMSDQIQYRVYAMLMTPRGAPTTINGPATAVAFNPAGTFGTPATYPTTWYDSTGINLLPLSQADLNP